MQSKFLAILVSQYRNAIYKSNTITKDAILLRIC